ncbi:MAG: hypothetical protein K9G43_05160 [Rhodobacteraceae bacterium]|nr:hypothetical protein [Paracoccaceae bacterium]
MRLVMVAAIDVIQFWRCGLTLTPLYLAPATGMSRSCGKIVAKAAVVGHAPLIAKQCFQVGITVARARMIGPQQSWLNQGKAKIFAKIRITLGPKPARWPRQTTGQNARPSPVIGQKR